MKAPVFVALMLSAFLPPGGAAQAPAPEEWRNEIEALKAAQAALRRDLEEIKAAVSPRRGPTPVESVDLVVDVADDPAKGDSAAPLVLVEFTDYQCPYCARHALETMRQIEETYVRTGKVRYVLRDLPLPFHRDAGKAAEAANCAGEQGRYWEMHDTLFANQKALAAERLPAYAAQIGLDSTAFRACLESGRHAGEVSADAADAGNAGIRGTPTFLLGPSRKGGSQVHAVRKISGARPFAALRDAIDAALAGLEGPRRPGL